MNQQFHHLSEDICTDHAINFAHVAYITKTPGRFDVYFVGSDRPLRFIETSSAFPVLQSWWERTIREIADTEQPVFQRGAKRVAASV